MRLSVVIATKDRAAYLERALQSFARQSGAPSFEIVVVDNGSTDSTAQVAERAKAQYEFPVTYLYEAQPNRGAARNRGVAAAHGHLILFCDDDVYAPPGFLAAHDAAHTSIDLVVSGPIINVASYDERPKPTAANFSRAFLCTCNVSIPKVNLQSAGGFDEAFRLYGWEDTELGVRLRDSGARAKFAWDAYIWHIKPPGDATLEVEMRKAIERARMAVQFVAKNPSSRVRMATGAYAANLARAGVLEKTLPWWAGLASADSTPAPLRALARSRVLDGIYTTELARATKAARGR